MTDLLTLASGFAGIAIAMMFAVACWADMETTRKAIVGVR